MGNIGIIVLIAVAVALVVTAIIALRHRQTTPADPLAHMKDLIKQGIIYEDEFVDVYYKVIRDEGFMDSFGANKDEARGLLSTMIDESKGHKTLLENVLANLK